MKKLFSIAFGIAVLSLTACTSSTNTNERQVPVEGDIDTSAIAGADRDEHGCVASAAYTWSELKRDCIRAFEVGHRLNPIDVPEGEAVESVFIVFNDDKTRAELFLPADNKENIILGRIEGNVYEKGKYRFDETTFALYEDGERKYEGTVIE